MPSILVPLPPNSTWNFPSSDEGAPQFGQGASFSGLADLQLLQNIFFAYLFFVYGYISPYHPCGQ